ncbi:MULTISPECIES: nitroreductase family protein [Carboxydocella]|uniref:Nitroreductase n=2 Tax=Carboxydocella TaxID=178898 RepID=A0A1T4LUE5_9FIRM|nr:MULTISPECIES: nitroreductase family protein [Carboxydocella]AVX20617.1 Nitroreductase [Carboxydocella thermautotrophica]AVX31039.1 Nitroreductase [Carboxydocella thermautotrophica]SJZ58305.1 Nitroreductase [Carboxydocella sporoproducens DSM 16521]GAW27940.1 nitroreductase [Carboxydocella sp. ULO1]GAW31545.1 nitroreductase [Carboxydocella sp. JDF658]
MDLFQAIRERRSIRKYEERPVEKEKIDLILEMARLAPSWKNMQCWRFLVIDKAENKQLMLSAFPDDNPGKKALAQAPVVIVVCANPRESGIEEGKEYYLADAAIAFEHICLSATALGLGTCWMGWFDEKTLKQSLNIPDEYKIVGVTPLGYPAQAPNPRPRKSLQEIAYYNEWGSGYDG